MDCCFGLGYLERAWRLFEADGKKLLNELEKKNLTKEFDFNNSYDYTQMLKDQIKIFFLEVFGNISNNLSTYLLSSFQTTP